MTTPLFSTYSQGENRVTATFLAVLQRLSLPNMNRILGALLSEEDFSMVTFANQPQGKGSVPDARIDVGHGLWIETKIASDAVNVGQIRKHMKAVGRAENLLVLTPDDYEPAGLWSPSLAQHYRDRIVWSNFSTLDGVMTEILEDNESPPSEFEAFLLREFSAFLQQEGLTITAKDRVMVVPAIRAWSRYNDKSIYGDMRGPNSMPSAHMAFYTGMEIKPIVPRVKSTVSPINIMNQEEVEVLDNYQKQVVEKLRHSHGKDEDWDHPLRVLFLSKPGNEETITLG